jgi:propionate CoA-transferase
MHRRTADEVAASIEDRMTILLSGNGEMLGADEVLMALEKRFRETGSPRDLTLFYNVFPGGKRPGTGVERLSLPGLLKRVYAGSYYSLHAMGLSELTLANAVEAYLVPYGAIYGMLRATSANQPGVLTRVGIGTFFDPRVGGGRITERTTEELVSVVEIHGEEFLFLPAQRFDLAILRGTTADEDGNISLEEEPNSMGVLLEAMAASASGGRVVVQVMRQAARGTIPPRDVVIPGIFVDEIVIEPAQMQHFPYNPAWTGSVRVPTPTPVESSLDHGTLIARRAARELRPGQLVNVGMGLAASVPKIAFAEGIADQVTFNVEHGPLGGVPNDREAFGPAVNMTSFLDSPAIFEMYAAGRLDLACLGFGQVDASGSVNVALINGRYNLGGFLDIVHAAKSIVFCGSFTAGGLETRVQGGLLEILREGRHRKFVSTIAHTSFGGPAGLQKGQRVSYVTERAVFTLGPNGLVLTEVAPGIDVQRQVLDLMDYPIEVSSQLTTMAAPIFRSAPMGLATANGFIERNRA